MKFSYFMQPCHHPRENPTLAFQRDISLIHLADELGFDDFFIGEHHSGGWETMPAPEMALSMAAANAHRIRLGTSVYSAPFHHPFHLAERTCFLWDSFCFRLYCCWCSTVLTGVGRRLQEWLDNAGSLRRHR